MKTSFAIWILWVAARFVLVAFLGVNIAAGIMLNEKGR